MNGSEEHNYAKPFDLSKWRPVPKYLIFGGGALAVLGLAINPTQFAFSWLLAFMFGLSLCAGAMFLVLFHHLFDAGWSVPIRRFCEHIASLFFPWLLLLFVPVAVFAPKLYNWMAQNPAEHHALKAKLPLFTVPMFYVVAALCFIIWTVLANRLRYWSLKQDTQDSDGPSLKAGAWQRLLGLNQDKPGIVECTLQMRKFACVGIFLFALSLTLAVIMWMKALQYEWFSTMYGVYFFAGSVWMTLGTVYVITMILDRQGVIHEILHEHQYYFLGSLLFAFTVFYAYVTFAQYFIIWNANMPEETFWFLQREKGTWFWVSMVIIFGHFFLPFLALLRIDLKNLFKWMVPLCAWTWVMHFVDLEFNIMPVHHQGGFSFKWFWLDVGCWAFVVGVLANRFLAAYASHPPYPLKDPRLVEAMGLHHPVPTQISGGEVPDLQKLGTATRPSRPH